MNFLLENKCSCSNIQKITDNSLPCLDILPQVYAMLVSSLGQLLLTVSLLVPSILDAVALAEEISSLQP